MATSINRPISSGVFHNYLVSIAVSRNRKVAARRKTAYFSVASKLFVNRPLCFSVGGNRRRKSDLQFSLEVLIGRTIKKKLTKKFKKKSCSDRKKAIL